MTEAEPKDFLDRLLDRVADRLVEALLDPSRSETPKSSPSPSLPVEAVPKIAVGFPCPKCDYIAKTKHGLDVHRGAKHPEKPKGEPQEPAVACPECGEKFRGFDAMKAHEAEAHPETDTRVRCSKCGAFFAGTPLLNRHVFEVHSGKAKAANG